MCWDNTLKVKMDPNSVFRRPICVRIGPFFVFFFMKKNHQLAKYWACSLLIKTAKFETDSCTQTQRLYVENKIKMNMANVLPPLQWELFLRSVVFVVAWMKALLTAHLDVLSDVSVRALNVKMCECGWLCSQSVTRNVRSILNICLACLLGVQHTIDSVGPRWQFSDVLRFSEELRWLWSVTELCWRTGFLSLF